MSQVDQALQTVVYWVRAGLGVLLGVFGVIDGFLRQALSQLGVPPGAQSLVILAVAVLFIMAVVRLFGGLFRIILIVLLVLLVLHVLVPNGSL